MPTTITLMSALTFPDEGDPRTFAQRRQATAWLFDAIDLHHPGFVSLALQAGASTEAVRTVPPAEKDGAAVQRTPLALAVDVLVATEQPQGAQVPPGEPVPPSFPWAVLDGLMRAGAHDATALRQFPSRWENDPRFEQVVHHVLNGVLNERAGSPALALVDPTKAGQARCRSVLAAGYLSVNGQKVQRPATSWMALAARHQREDVIDHLIAQEVPINAMGVSARVSALATAWTAWTTHQVNHDRIVRTLTGHWHRANDDVFRGELLQQMTQWVLAHRQPAADVERLAQWQASLEHAVIARPSRQLLTDAVTDWWTHCLKPEDVARAHALARTMEASALRQEVHRARPDDGLLTRPPARPRL